MKSFAEARGEKLRFFVCGPTVYDFAHIGHARTYIAFDVIVKYLRKAGHKVFYLQNITDIDDKIINRAKESKETPQALARKFEKAYLQDMKALRVNSVTKYARATAYIKEIASQVQRLLAKKYAYEIVGDGIYFDIAKFKDYGKLSGRTTEQAEDATSRIDESIKKRNKGDFALWKYSKPGEPNWPFDSLRSLRADRSEERSGRPGWHIEDTAITEKHFGAQYDIHGGAKDLLFPHHEAEIAQMEAISGKKPLVKYWMHTGFLTIGGEKMSKSLGNFITVRDFLAKHSSRLLRFLILKTHYRSPIDYSENILEQAKQELGRIDEFTQRVQNVFARSKNRAPSNIAGELKEMQIQFFEAMDDDFNTPEALAVLFMLIKQGNILLTANAIRKLEAKEILSFLKDIDVFFDFVFVGRGKQNIPAKIVKLVQQREKYRTEKNWQKADDLRKQIELQGWQVEDMETGPKLKKSDNPAS